MRETTTPRYVIEGLGKKIVLINPRNEKRHKLTATEILETDLLILTAIFTFIIDNSSK